LKSKTGQRENTDFIELKSLSEKTSWQEKIGGEEDATPQPGRLTRREWIPRFAKSEFAACAPFFDVYAPFFDASIPGLAHRS
jgi:hypothetical protein